MASRTPPLDPRIANPPEPEASVAEEGVRPVVALPRSGPPTAVLIAGMVAAAIIFLGAGSGVIASTVNPFSTGVASDAAGISIGDGIGLRIALWFVLVALAIGYVT